MEKMPKFPTEIRMLLSKKNNVGQNLTAIPFCFSAYFQEILTEAFKVSSTCNSFKHGWPGKLKASTGCETGSKQKKFEFASGEKTIALDRLLDAVIEQDLASSPCLIFAFPSHSQKQLFIQLSGKDLSFLNCQSE